MSFSKLQINLIDIFRTVFTENIDVGTGVLAASSGTISLVDDDSKVATMPIENLDRETEAVFSDEDGENLGRCTKNEENTDDDDDLPLSKVSIANVH